MAGNFDSEEEGNKQPGAKPGNIPEDLTDPPHDQERLQGEVVRIDLPDVSDIPGQENIKLPPLGEFGDSTISSADEEGVVNAESDPLDEPGAEEENEEG